MTAYQTLPSLDAGSALSARERDCFLLKAVGGRQRQSHCGSFVSSVRAAWGWAFSSSSSPYIRALNAANPPC